MKKLFIAMAAMFVTTMCMTACLGDDSDSTYYHTLTSDEKSLIMTALTGDYEGFVGIVTSSNDTLSANINFKINSDTTLTLNYPISLLANVIDTARTSLREAIAEAGVQQIDLNLYIPVAVYNTYWDSYWANSCFIPTLYANNYSKTFSAGEKTITLTFDTYLDLLNNGYLYNFIYYDKQAQGYIRPLTLEYTNADGATEKVELNTISTFYGSK